MELADEQDKTLEVEIERLLPGGVGLAHAEGLTLFVSLAAPGDVVRVRVDRVQGKLGFASIVEIVNPSTVRVEPPCPYFGLCGGCDFQQLTYEAQLNAKVDIIRDCLHRIAKIEPREIPIIPSPNEWRYRARAMWQVDALRSRLGYFVRGSNEVCDVEYCAVLVPELQQRLEQVRNEISAESDPPLKAIEAVAGDDGVSTVSHPPNRARFPGKEVSRVIGGETYCFSAEGFFQINHQLLKPLIAEALCDIPLVVKEVGVSGTAIDLYCGVGLFTLPLARRFARVVGVEANERATKFARRNLEFANLSNAQVVTARVGDWLKQHSRSFGQVEFLLLDPPRTGAENKDIAGMLALRPTRISYVSCDPATLARDLKKLINAGYSLDSIVAFDMFPQTHHVETVARLSTVDL
ncbi:MAG: class I SAM-dependent RNA methyltransferase [Acidobacteriota bacterium]|nr:class I SAM-dependent RNA methyltransferase [Acidobacteriota bacterium]